MIFIFMNETKYNGFGGTNKNYILIFNYIFIFLLFYFYFFFTFPIFSFPSNFLETKHRIKEFV